MLLMSILPFSNNVFHPIKERIHKSNQSISSCFYFNPLQILDSSKLKEFADDKFEFDENGRKLSKQIENIACYEQFLLFPQCFQKACFLGASKGVIVWEWVNKHIIFFKLLTASPHQNTHRQKQTFLSHSFNTFEFELFDNRLTLYRTILHFDTLKIYSCRKHCEKRRKCL